MVTGDSKILSGVREAETTISSREVPSTRTISRSGVVLGHLNSLLLIPHTGHCQSKRRILSDYKRKFPVKVCSGTLGGSQYNNVHSRNGRIFAVHYLSRDGCLGTRKCKKLKMKKMKNNGLILV